MHAATVFRIMNEPHKNILENLEKSEFSNVRKLIIEMILNTDMSKHLN